MTDNSFRYWKGSIKCTMKKFTDRMQKFRDKEQFEADQPFEHPKENKK